MTSLRQTFYACAFEGSPDFVTMSLLEQSGVHPSLMSAYRDNNLIQVNLASGEMSFNQHGQSEQQSYSQPEEPNYQYVDPASEDFDWERIDNGTVRVGGDVMNRSGGNGTGTVIRMNSGDDYVVTASHVIDGGMANGDVFEYDDRAFVRIYDTNEQPVYGEVVAVEGGKPDQLLSQEYTDTALLRIIRIGEEEFDDISRHDPRGDIDYTGFFVDPYEYDEVVIAYNELRQAGSFALAGYSGRNTTLNESFGTYLTDATGFRGSVSTPIGLFASERGDDIDPGHSGSAVFDARTQMPIGITAFASRDGSSGGAVKLESALSRLNDIDNLRIAESLRTFTSYNELRDHYKSDDEGLVEDNSWQPTQEQPIESEYTDQLVV